MSAARLRVRAASYVDSVKLMGATRAMRAAGGVDWAAAVMATGANLSELRAAGFEPPDAGANDLILAVRAADGDAAALALDEGEAALDREAGGGGGGQAPGVAPDERVEDPNVAVVSVPGAYAALEAHKALSAGLHVLLFSDNVTVDDEIGLKRRARELGLLVMGPGAGTAALGGTGLGFANVVRRGPVGIVAAAGTGAQEVMSLLHGFGTGVTHVIGVGGRDLSAQVGGLMAGQAVRALAADPGTELLLLVSKPPDPAVAARLLSVLAGTPAVAALLGLEELPDAPAGVEVATSLEAAVLAVMRRLGVAVADPAAGLGPIAKREADRLAGERTAIRGLFSGGTLCYETLCAASRHIGPIHSNTPIRAGWGLPAPAGAHVCLDLGEQEYTRGRPHPMLDPAARAEPIAEAGADPRVGVVLLDVVLGYGAHADPAGVLAPACADVAPDVAVVAYVLGTDADPQDRAAQCRTLEEAGCVLAPTATRAALLAAAIATRRPELAEAPA